MLIFCCAALLSSCFWGAENRWEHRLGDDLRAARADRLSRLEALKRSLAEYDSEEAFREACRNAGVPDSLQFTVRIENME